MKFFKEKLVTDPIMRRAIKMREVEAEQISLFTRIKRDRRRLWELKKEYLRLKTEAKNLRKYGSPEGR